MDPAKILKELRDEAILIERAIIVFEQMMKGTAKRRGRPPKWLAKTEALPAEAISDSRTYLHGLTRR